MVVYFVEDIKKRKRVRLPRRYEVWQRKDGEIYVESCGSQSKKRLVKELKYLWMFFNLHFFHTPHVDPHTSTLAVQMLCLPNIIIILSLSLLKSTIYLSWCNNIIFISNSKHDLHLDLKMTHILLFHHFHLYNLSSTWKN